MDARSLIEALELRPLGFEGGWFKETLRIERVEAFNSSPNDDDRSLHTAILYMLTPDTRGLMHRLRYDEFYHFYLGDPVDLVLLRPGGGYEHVILGHDIAAGQRLQFHVPAGVWQGSRVRPGGQFGLMGTSMAPGFDLRDFELGDREALIASWPAAREWLIDLTPAVHRSEALELVAATRDLVHAELQGANALAAGTRSACREWPPSGHTQEGLRHLLARLEVQEEPKGWRLWYVVRRQDRALVGVLMFDGPPREGRVAFSYALVRGARGLQAAIVEAGASLAFSDETVRQVEAIGAGGADQDQARHVLHRPS